MGFKQCPFYPPEAGCRQRDTPICSKWCDKYMLYNAVIGQSHIPKRFQGLFLWNFPGGPEGNRNYALTERFLQGGYIEQGSGLYLYSEQVGTGKTTVACTIANEYLVHEMWAANLQPLVAYVVVPEFLDRIRESWSDPDEELYDLLENIRTVPLVIWDDIGAERPSEWVRERLYTLINHRYTEELANIFTSNLPLERLGEQLGPRIASRIRGMCMAVEVTGPDHRRVGL